jgi:hypothetical protein
VARIIQIGGDPPLLSLLGPGSRIEVPPERREIRAWSAPQK